jgi:hypothetical protein
MRAKLRKWMCTEKEMLKRLLKKDFFSHLQTPKTIAQCHNFHKPFLCLNKTHPNF